MMLQCVVFVVFINSVCAEILTPVITTSGHLKGRIEQTPNGPVRQFLGVRFAEAPIGNLRFMPPQPYRTSNADVVSADTFAPACMQLPHRTEFMYSQLARGQKNRKVSEDCLFLNIFIPSDVISVLRAILIFLPGEGFSFADPAQWDASRLAIRGDIIVITVAYRVGVLGFLGMNTKAAPGNAGLWDVLQALHWVHDNAASLGGDPKRVTLMGRFSGSMAASLLLTSPLMHRDRRPLVQRFILQSGVATSDYVLDPEPRNRTLSLAALANCPHNDEIAILRCLRELEASELDRISWHVAELWRPVVDGRLVLRVPWQATHLGEVPYGVDVMIGETSNEGALCLLQHFFLETSLASHILADTITRRNFDDLISEHVRDHTKVANTVFETMVKHEYRHALPNTLSYRTRFLHFCGVLYSRVASEQLARELSRHGTRVFRYEFAHRPSMSLHPAFLGAAHGDDALFVFALLDAFVEGNHTEPEPQELILQSQVVETWSSFIKTGNPNNDTNGFTMKWPQFWPSSHELFVIRSANTSYVSSTTFLDRDLEFWGNVAPAVLRATRPYVCAIAPRRGRGAAVLIIVVLALLVMALFAILAALHCHHTKRHHVLLEMQTDT